MYSNHDTESLNFKDKCGVIAVFNSQVASEDLFCGLHSLQHRGQEAGGMVTFISDEMFKIKKHHGTIFSQFSAQDIKYLSSQDCNKAYSGIGHVRYSTSGSKDDLGIQPFFREQDGVGIALAHNGNLTNYNELKEKVEKAGIKTQTSIDTELILHLIFLSNKSSIKEKIIDAVSQIKGAFSLVILTKDFICGIRDEFGIRPLSMGVRNENEIFFASETCALDAMNAKTVKDVKNGEFIFVSNDGIESIFPFEKKQEKFCIFEYVYFARPDSILQEKSVYNVRKEIGRILAKQDSQKIEADIVVPVPDSGIPAALGYSLESKIPFEFGIIRSHYIGRTFIDPAQKVRVNKVKMKHNPNRSIIEGKRIILVDDSIVRGTTSKKIVQLLFEFGAKEVHMRISSPPTKYPCFYGIDTPNEDDLIANKHSIQEIKEFIGANSLEYIDLKSLKQAVNNSESQSFCDACFTKEYFV